MPLMAMNKNNLQTEETVMTVEQMNSKLAKAQEAESHLDRALLCRALLEDAVDFIYSKAGGEKTAQSLSTRTD